MKKEKIKKKKEDKIKLKKQKIKTKEEKIKKDKTKIIKTEPINNKEKKINKIKVKTKEKQYIGKYVMFKEGEYFFKYQLKANNGQSLILSEPYRTKEACKNGINTLQKNVDSLQVDFERDKHGKWCFRLITKQGRPLAQSAYYDTRSLALSASESYKRFVDTPVIDFDKEESSHFKVVLFKEKVQKNNNGKYTIVKDDEDDYMYSLLASNGRILCTSQAYKSNDSCKEAIERFRKTVYEGDFYIYIDKRGNAFFKLYNSQLRLIMSGEVYQTKQLAISAVKSILSFAEDAKLV